MMVIIADQIQDLQTATQKLAAPRRIELLLPALAARLLLSKQIHYHSVTGPLINTLMDIKSFASQVRSKLDDLYLQLLKTLSSDSYQKATTQINAVVEYCFELGLSVDDAVARIRRLPF